MDNELRYLLQQGPTSVKELARLSGKSTSTLYKALKNDEVIVSDGENGKLFSLSVEESAVNGPGATAEAPEEETPIESPVVAPAPQNGPAKRGRKATGAGKRLTAASSDNPRHKDSHGYRSLQIIIDTPGITTEDFVAAGGRLNDLRWDIKHGNVKAED